ncbi:juvenile hormone acid O-methyltransferase-like [Haematobia irritans]|uniref:juvenile hormone acid O-methyltransferase-like n=1 Tax=Haematobia irritans TaxID=7368 RepID=UPI003F509026
MVEYAKSIYGHLEKIEFTTLNIESKNELAKDLKGQFDHLTSFNVLHWTKDLRQSFHNIYDLLRPHDGDCLLLFTIDFGGLYDILNRLRMAFKWSKYLNNLGCITAPLHHSRNPKNDLFIILNDVGFSEYEIHITNKVFDYDNEAIFQKNMNAVNPFLKFIPAGSHQQFSRAFVDTAISLGFKNTTNERIRFHYKAVVIYARK